MPQDTSTSWSFSPQALTVRRYLYSRYLSAGRGASPSEIAAATDLKRDEVRAALEELERGVMVMLERDTDAVVRRCPPWSDIPTDHRIEVDGAFAAYAGCALEAVNAAFAYPGSQTTIKSACPHCGEPIELEFAGAELVDFSPEATVVHIGLNPRSWDQNWVAACANTNFFSSPAHVSAWEASHPEFRGVTMPLAEALKLPRYTNRLDYERGPDDDGGERFFQAIDSLFGTPEHWQRPAETSQVN
jgi:hypothetical protein